MSKASKRSSPSSAADTVAAVPPAVRGPALPYPVALGGILLAAAVLHREAVRAAFFADDYLFLDQVRGRSLWAALQAPDPLSNFLRPLSRQVWFWVVGGLSHESPFAFHAGNLVFVLLAVFCLAGLVRRIAGERAALIAAGAFALHYSADVAVRWGSGSQDAMATAFALAALWLFVAGRRAWAALALLAAAFCKEIVVLAPLIAVPLARRPGERWAASARRAWPLAAAIAVYVAASLLVPHARKAAQYEVVLDPVQGPLAALAHLPQVALGLEWLRDGGLRAVLPPLLPLALVLAAVLLGGRGATHATRPRGVAAGIAWALLATAPVAAVAHLWSAYYYLFAAAGLALALGAGLAARRLPWAAAAITLLAAGSAIGRDVPGFTAPRDRWSTTSHVNRAHIDRATHVSAGYLASLQRLHPTLPHGATLFFAGVQGGVAFQRADGPLLRWAYRDTSLRGYFQSQFTRARYDRGLAYFFSAEGDSLAPMPPGDDLLARVAFGQAMSDALPAAQEALLAHLEAHPGDDHFRWWLAWTATAAGDTATARAQVERLAPGADRTPDDGRAAVLAALAAGDTAAAIARASRGVSLHPWDGAAHGLLADLLLIREPGSPDGAMLALAARALSPADPYAWRRWAQVQYQRERTLEAWNSLERYFALSGGAPGDAEAHAWSEALHRSLAGRSAATVGE